MLVCGKDATAQGGFEPTQGRLSVLVVMRLRPLGHLVKLYSTGK